MSKHKKTPPEQETAEAAEAPSADTETATPAPEAAAPSEAPPVPEAAQTMPEADVKALKAERDELKDRYLRAMADFDNYRKRMARESERMRKIAAEQIIRGLLPVLDNLERALEHKEGNGSGLADGVAMVLDQMRDVLKNNGLEPIAAAGCPFDPQLHEAVMRAESAEHPADHVVQEFQRGYKLGDYVLRPAKVAVNVAAPEEEA
jgi:molecular chaperone GrpE